MTTSNPTTEPGTTIARNAILNQLAGRVEPTAADLRVFVRMIETRYATDEDFEAVGGMDLAGVVLRAWWYGEYPEDIGKTSPQTLTNSE
jgi:hypothetical protein